MTFDEYRKEIAEMEKKSLTAFLEATHPEGYKNPFNPWHKRKFMFLECSNWYMSMRQIFDAIKEL